MTTGVRNRVAAAVFVVTTLSALLPAPSTAVPLIGFNIRGGQYTDVNDFFLGAGVDVDAILLTASPNFEWVFVDKGTLYTLNLDASYRLPLAVAQFWAGAGYALRYFEPEGGNGKSKGGLNLFVGAGLGLVPLRPFVQLKYLTISGADEELGLLGDIKNSSEHGAEDGSRVYHTGVKFRTLSRFQQVLLHAWVTNHILRAALRSQGN